MCIPQEELFALMGKGVAAIEHEIMTFGTDEDRSSLDYVLHGRTGDNDKYDVGRQAGLDLAHFCQLPQARQAGLGTAHIVALRLCAPPTHVGHTSACAVRAACSGVSSRLCARPRADTLPVYKSMNNPLRDATRKGRGERHGLPATVGFVSDGVKKARVAAVLPWRAPHSRLWCLLWQLRAVAAKEVGAHTSLSLWRGIRDMQMTDDFMLCGGTELAPMST